MSEILILHLKREYWEQIRRGVKVEEYRMVTPYWEKRLSGRRYSRIYLYCGYPKSSDATKILCRKWNGCVKKQITHKHFGDKPVSVFAIDLSSIPEKDYSAQIQILRDKLTLRKRMAALSREIDGMKIVHHA